MGTRRRGAGEAQGINRGGIVGAERIILPTMRPRAFTFGRARGLDHRFGDSLGVEGAGALGFRESFVTILSPFSSRYIATTIVPSWSALGRITDPSGVSSLVPSARVILVPVSSTLCTWPTSVFSCAWASAHAGAKTTRPASISLFN